MISLAGVCLWGIVGQLVVPCNWSLRFLEWRESGSQPSYERLWRLYSLLRQAQGSWPKFEGKEGSRSCWCPTEPALAVDCEPERRQAGGRQTGLDGKHQGLKEGGGREMEKKG